MCQKKPALRCYTHAQVELKKAEGALKTAQQLASSYEEGELPPKISRRLTTAHAVLEKRKLEALENAISRYPSSKALLKQAEEEQKAVPSEALLLATETVSDVEALKARSPEGFKILHSLVRAKQALPAYRASGKLPELNQARVELMELLREQASEEYGEKEAKILAIAKRELVAGKSAASDTNTVNKTPSSRKHEKLPPPSITRSSPSSKKHAEKEFLEARRKTIQAQAQVSEARPSPPPVVRKKKLRKF
ncbi:hypothetical protein ICM05_05315 [Leucobacter sp. cx-42]|uniref:hypothetical protein n=1 Tax=unclassified Leucobacter TaxID=2621730 RepID=UPI00165E2464|nr:MULTISPECIES: hypothetical protein [unclassified Leucobacter]MBC9954065.1 hypothetical protein [Leucobacter sp. cx-42]